MSNITIGRYAPGDCGHWTGWIEGKNDDDTSWITFLGEGGRPELHWPNRDESGGVVGDPVVLSARPS